MQTVTYKCPNCGDALRFDGSTQRLTCASCGTEIDSEGIAAAMKIEQEDAHFEQLNWNMAGGSYDESPSTHVCLCQSCGAELIADENTTATECAYCGSPIILADNLSGGVRPEYVLPFNISEDQARKMFSDYFTGKRLIPNIFENTRNRITEIRRLYVPYWLFSCKADANVTYNATRVRISRRGDLQETRTSHYLVRRTGCLDFDRIPVDGSEKLDNRITESLEPFDFSQAISFSPETLSGSLADRSDVEESVCRDRANERLRVSTRAAFRNTVIGYNMVTEQSCKIHLSNGTAVPVLLPIWMIRTQKTEKGKAKTYTFAINGQTGKLTCDVPFSKARAAKWFFGLTAGIFAAGYGVIFLLAQFGMIGGGF